MTSIGVYVLSIASVAGLAALVVALAALKTFRRGLETRTGPEQVLGGFESAAERLAAAVREAETLRSGLESMAAGARSPAGPENISAEAGTADHTSIRIANVAPARSEPVNASGPRVVSQTVRHSLERVRRLAESGASPEQISEQTGLAESEVRFVLGMLGL